MKLDKHDLNFAATRLPKILIEVMKDKDWADHIFVGGGYLRSIVSGEKVNDVDIFVSTKEKAELLALKLCSNKKDLIQTENAYTVKGFIPIQIIHRWVFEKMEDVSNSFDFTICCAVLKWNIEQKCFESYCDERFYIDLASKRLVYRRPIRNEDAGGSMLRVLKYYQKGYRIPLDSLGYVMARMVKEVNFNLVNSDNEEEVGRELSGLLREVDPSIDPNHASHLPSTLDQ